METAVEHLPRWDMSTIYPSLDSPEFAAAFDAVLDGIDALAALYDARGVRRRADGTVDAALAAAVDEVLTRTNEFYRQYETVEAYIYYNYPYTFGQLFGLGLFAHRRADPAGFTAAFDDLLASTGLADAAPLAARFGIDIRTPAFWRASLDVLRQRIDEFAALATKQR
jgi:oligoendopeptidase F